MDRPTWEGVKRTQYKRSYLHFIKEYWSIVEPHEFIIEPYIEYLARQYEVVFKWAADWSTQSDESYHLLVNLPPGTSKSTLASKLSPAYLWALNKDMSMVTSSYAAHVVKEFTNSLKKLINADEFLEVYPELKLIEDNVGTQRNQFKGRRFTTSTSSAISGMHFDLLNIDDHDKPPQVKLTVSGKPVVNQGARLTEILAGRNWFDSVLTTRVTHKQYSRYVVTQQRVHEKDFSSHIINKAKAGIINLRHICLPATLDITKPLETTYINGEVKEESLKHLYSNGLLSPKRLTRKDLKKQKGWMGSYYYLPQFEQKPKRDAGGLLKRGFFQTINAKELPENLVKFYYTDPSEGNVNSDNIATMCFSVHNHNLVVWEVMLQVLPFGKFIGHRDANGKYQPEAYDYFVEKHGGTDQTIHIWEAKSLGSAYISKLRTETNYNVKADKPTASKLDRVKMNLGTIETGRVQLVATGNPAQDAWIDVFLDECENFSGEEGGQDDQVDCLTGTLNNTSLAAGSIFELQEEEKKKLLPY